MVESVYLELVELEKVQHALEVARDAGAREENVAKFLAWATEEPLDEVAELILTGRLVPGARRARRRFES
jgi:hypothetical protein